MKLSEITCLSDLYYVIGRWFTVTMVAIAYVVLPFALDVWDSPFSFLMCASLAFVGVAADYKAKEHDLHVIAAATSAVCSIVWVACVEPFSLLALSLSAAGLFDKKRSLLWCELGCFFSVVLAFIMNM